MIKSLIVAFDNLLSSLSAYATIVAVPIGLATLALTERGSSMLTSTSRNARTALRPSEGTCERSLWVDLRDGPLHTSMWTANSYQMSHTKGARCWESTLTTVVSNWSAASYVVKKPECLPLSKEFLHTDLRVILAFVFMAVLKERPRQTEYRPGPRTFTISGAVLEMQIIKPDIVILHLEGTIQRTFTKDYVQRLLGGYPPLLVDPQNVSVFKAGDEARGGWVAALGLASNYDPEDVFLPVYSDCLRYHSDRRGRFFWRSMDRVRLILENIWAKAFKDDAVAYKQITSAINALEFIHKYETESGVDQIFNIATPPNLLSAQDQNRIIAHFNGPPHIADDEEQQRRFRAEWQPLLRYVLIAAVRGWVICIAYFKNPGRELEHILPMEVLKSAKLYLRGC
ncbi:hypothetical protein CNMCM5793_001479 [Aspergillus hiratsukae]|uniref:Uncharacterized protein n=1 Tax=Aspergillus hiratsukae TaxID=1194566 RepID=A0A8H6PBA6_9EURO|nr:hypothetical protein CNMCM5793_001479 [Aspergillus hiratsukae]KAF7164658.1 hypothetical protein CNMCM6106_001110 [Aspergillus hiratsukae]